jgi:hypothetical protein
MDAGYDLGATGDPRVILGPALPRKAAHTTRATPEQPQQLERKHERPERESPRENIRKTLGFHAYKKHVFNVFSPVFDDFDHKAMP